MTFVKLSKVYCGKTLFPGCIFSRLKVVYKPLFYTKLKS